MKKTFDRLIEGYQRFQAKYTLSDDSKMKTLSIEGQKPEVMVVACCDARVDPALILQCDPGDLFIVRNVANVVPPYEKDETHHGTSAALEFGIRYLKVKHLIIFGHSQCAGIELLFEGSGQQNDFISPWISMIKADRKQAKNTDELAQLALAHSYENCLSFPWIKERIKDQTLAIHLWFFNVKEGKVFAYSFEDKQYHPLST